MVLAVAGFAGVDAARGVPASATPAQAVHWAPCERSGFDCATLPVPLDYDHPSGAVVELALIRLPATDPAHRIGSLLLNPGGPGGSGVDMVLSRGTSMPARLRARFDLVGFDPRGVDRSTPVLCGDTGQPAPTPPGLPLTPVDINTVTTFDLAFAAACAPRGSRIVDHMSTADVARDLDRIRAALGERQLSYLGFSYGSMIGTTYANLFPGRVRAIAIDGVLDPVEWTTGARGDRALPFSTRLRSDEGSQRTIEEFFRLCDAAGPACAFSGNSAARFAALHKRLLGGPITIESGGRTSPFGYTDLIDYVSQALSSITAWPFLAQALAYLESAAAPQRIGAAVDDLRASLGYGTTNDPPRHDNSAAAFAGVTCTDSDNPIGEYAWYAAAEDAEARYGYFGRYWTWTSSVCAHWPGRAPDRYTGPWNARTAHPVLVVGNFYDPETPYSGARKVASLLPNSRLLSYAGWGHTAFFNGSTCAVNAVVAYLVDGALPARGTVCPPEMTPFPAIPVDPAVAGQHAVPTDLAAPLPGFGRP